MTERCQEYDCPNINSRWCWACQYYVPVIVKDPEPEPEWVQRQWDTVEQIRAEVTGWRRKHAEMMLELDKLQKKPRKPKSKWD